MEKGNLQYEGEIDCSMKPLTSPMRHDRCSMLGTECFPHSIDRKLVTPSSNTIGIYNVQFLSSYTCGIPSIIIELCLRMRWFPTAGCS